MNPDTGKPHYDRYLLSGFGPANPLRQAVEDHLDAIPRRNRPTLPKWILAAVNEKMERDQQQKGGDK